MNINRLVHPGFWFGKTPLQEALQLARMGVGGFCLYGGTRPEVAALTQALRAAVMYVFVHSLALALQKHNLHRSARFCTLNH